MKNVDNIKNMASNLLGVEKGIKFKNTNVGSRKLVVVVSDVMNRKILIFTDIEKLSYYLKIGEETMRFLLSPKDYDPLDLNLKNDLQTKLKNKGVIRLEMTVVESWPVISAVVRLGRDGAPMSILLDVEEDALRINGYKDDYGKRCVIMEESNKLNNDIFNWLEECLLGYCIQLSTLKILSVHVTDSKIDILF